MVISYGRILKDPRSRLGVKSVFIISLVTLEIYLGDTLHVSAAVNYCKADIV